MIIWAYCLRYSGSCVIACLERLLGSYHDTIKQMTAWRKQLINGKCSIQEQKQTKWLIQIWPFFVLFQDIRTWEDQCRGWLHPEGWYRWGHRYVPRSLQSFASLSYNLSVSFCLILELWRRHEATAECPGWSWDAGYEHVSALCII